MTPLLVVLGPTASGKTRLAIALARCIGGEIVSADSMQVYRGMAIGTAAPTPEEQAAVPHHLVGFLDPATPYSAGAFQRDARRIAREIRARGRHVVVAGGSGLYLRALVDGLFEGPPADPAVRRRLHDEAARRGVEALHARLATADPLYADRTGPRDLKRIVRALEVIEATGQPFTAVHRTAEAEPWPAVRIGLDVPRDALYRRIDKRVDVMLEAGFVEEVRRLMAAGYEAELARLRSLGYPEFAAFVRGELSFEEARERMQRNTRRFARRQMSWFRGDERIHWLAAPPERPVDSLVEEALAVWAAQSEQR